MSKTVERTQTGVRVEKRILKVLKGLAEYHSMSLSDLLEGIVLHSFENKPPFSAESLATIEKLRDVYGLDLRADDSHRLSEASLSAGPSTDEARLDGRSRDEPRTDGSPS